jgi:hypothetical protein
LTLIKAATFWASVKRFALTGESGNMKQTTRPVHIVKAPTTTKKIRQDAKSVVAKEMPYAVKPPKM